MRFAYADPPYLGLAAKFYGDPTYDALDAHADLLRRLDSGYPAWAYSLHAPSLKQLAPLLPDGARFGAWAKSWASFKPGVDPAYTWEPLFFRSVRKWSRDKTTARDYVVAPIATGRKFKGAKSPKFCFWMFDLLGARPDDQFDDLFAGSGAVTRAWKSYQRQLSLVGVA